MKNWFRLREKQRRTIFEQVGLATGLPAAAIEKDWWVTYCLRLVFGSELGKHFIFKGGTSLSKGWGLIERFSEDIHLAIDREFLGFAGELSKGQIRRLRKKACAFLTDEFPVILEKQISKTGAEEVNVAVPDFEDSDKDPQIIEVFYPSVTETIPYIRSRVVLEIGARSLLEPFEMRSMRSLVAGQYPDTEFADPSIEIPTVLPAKTFLEKVCLLHEEFQKTPGYIRAHRMSRHLYDVARIMDTSHAQDALSDHELFDTIVAHRAKFNALRGIDYQNYTRANLEFLPPDSVRKAWESDYRTMRESMIFGESLPYEKLVQKLAQLKSALQSA